MKSLIAVMSCEAYRVNGNNQALRDTWLPDVSKEVGVDYKIFMGQGSQIEEKDEVLLDVPDDYGHVSYKGREVSRYVLQNGYDFVYKCYPDTYVCPSRLMTSGFENYDYMGNFSCVPRGKPSYCTGGVGYWSSRDVNAVLVDADIPTYSLIYPHPPRRPIRSPKRDSPVICPPTIVYEDRQWAEDKWAGFIIGNYPSFKKLHDVRYEEDVYAAGPEKVNGTIAIHLSRSREGQSALYDKQWMYDKHNRWLGTSERAGKVAIITPTVPNRASLLEECKASVRAQDWSGEITHEICQDLNGEGPSKVRNRMISKLDPSYEWLAFVDDDDKILPNHISTLVEASSGADIIYSDSTEEGFIKVWKVRSFNYEDLKRANYIPVTVLMRRSLFEKIGGYTIPPPGEDQDLWLRAALAGGRFVYVPRVTWIYRQHPQHRGRQ